ncbi:MAG: hypothetical protein ACREGG_04590 [Candidatus Saccharimonadales bacterium]
MWSIRKKLPKYKNAEEMLTDALRSALTKQAIEGYRADFKYLQNQFPKILGAVDPQLAAIHIGCINQTLFSYSWYVYIDTLGLGGINNRGIEMGILIIRAWRNASRSRPDLGIYNHEYDENIDEYLRLATSADQVASRDLSNIAHWFVMSILARKDWDELEKPSYYSITSLLNQKFEDLAAVNLAIYQAQGLTK